MSIYKEASDFDKAYSTIVRVRCEDVDGGKSTDDLMNGTVAEYCVGQDLQNICLLGKI